MVSGRLKSKASPLASRVRVNVEGVEARTAAESGDDALSLQRPTHGLWAHDLDEASEVHVANIEDNRMPCDAAARNVNRRCSALDL